MNHQSQIQLVLRIPLLKRVYGISYPLKFCRKQRVYYWCGLEEVDFWTSNWVYLNFDSPSWFCNFLLKIQLLAPLSICLNLIILESLCENKPQNIRIIAEVKKIRVKNPSGGCFTFCTINVYGLECFKCVWHDILRRIYLTLPPSGWYFTGLRIMVRHPCTW